MTIDEIIGVLKQQIRVKRTRACVMLTVEEAKIVVANAEYGSALGKACEQLLNAPHNEHFSARLNEQELAGLEAIKVALAELKR